jgi:hypothetical protein
MAWPSPLSFCALGPALVLLLFVGVLRAQAQMLSVTEFEAAMGPMIGASIVAMDRITAFALMPWPGCRFRRNVGRGAPTLR